MPASKPNPNDSLQDGGIDVAQKNYNERVSRNLANAESGGTFSQDSSSGDSSDSENVRNRENNGDSTARGGWANNTSETGGSRFDKGKSGKGKFSVRKKGALAAILSILGFGGLGIGFMGAFLGPIAFIETITDDLNDQLAAMEISSTKVLRGKVPTAVKREAIKGCTTLSIKCKFKTISDKQVAKLKAAGIEVIPDDTFKGILGGKRVVPGHYMFQGNQFTPEGWLDELNNNSSARRSQLKANNMKYSSVSDKTFKARVMKRFNISKKPLELKGTQQERINALLNKAGTNSVSDLKFSPVTDSDGNQKWTLDGDIGKPGEEPKQYTKAERDEMEKSISRARDVKPPSKVTKAGIGALSVLGYWDMACSIKNMIGGAAVAAKVANQMELAAYAMGIATKVHEIKAGNASPEDAEAIGNFFNETSPIKEVPNLTSSFDDGSYTEKGLSADELNDHTLVDNPYSKSALSSNLYQMSMDSSVIPNASPMVSLGMGQNTLLSGVSGAAEIAGVITNLGAGNNICNVVQNWGVRILGIVASVAVGIGSGGGTVAAQAIVAAGMIGAMITLEIILNNALGGSVIEAADLANNTSLRGDAVWTGMSSVFAAGAQSRGLMPASSGEILAYQQVSNQVNQEYIALERSESGLFDMYSQHSFLGSFTRSILKGNGGSGSLSFNTLGSIARATISTLGSNVYASSANPERFKKCDDSAYIDLGIDADLQCNVRFVMPAEDLALDVDEVLQWMEDNNYVEQNTTTGLPKGYKPLDAGQSQGAVLDFITGAADGFVNQFIDTRAASIELAGGTYNEYAKYLDYCAYRTMPYGETFTDNQPAGGVSDDWLTGKKCREKSQMMSYFRMYTLYVSTEAAIEGEDDEDSSPTSAAGATIDMDNLFEDSTQISCAPGTTDVGIDTGYINRVPTPVRLCSIPDTDKGGSEMRVNSRISGAVLALTTKMRADLNLSKVRISDAFRYMESQEHAWRCASGGRLPGEDCSDIAGAAAFPGTSKHQSGLAIDFQLETGNKGSTRPGDRIYDWLVTNAGSFGFKKLDSESWHWSPTGE